MPAQYEVRIDWNGDGTFSAVGDDVTKRVLERTTLSMTYGRDQVRALSPISPGEAELEINNQSRDYSPENAASPLAGNVLPGRDLRIQATVAGVTYSLYRGFLDDYDVLPDVETKSVKLSAVDLLGRFRDATVSIDLQSGIRTGAAIGLILDKVGWPAASRDIDPGATVIPWYWEERTDALAALQKLIASEGPGSTAYVGGDGSFVFRDRHHHLTRAASKTSQATFRGGGTSPEPIISTPLVYDQGWRDIVNDVTVAVAERQPAAELSAVWTSDATLSIADGETLLLIAEASDPFYSAVPPVAGTDYTPLSGAVSITMSRTSGQSTTLYITASGGPAVLQGIQVRGYAVRVARTVQVKASDPTSQSKYGVRSYPGGDPAPWAGVHDARAIAEMILAQRAERLPIVRIRLVSANDTRLVHQLVRDLSDRITIVDTETGLNAEFYIERIEHTVLENGLFLETVFGCEKVPAQTPNVFILGSATRGVLGTNRLGKDGLDDPANVFILGSATQGVLGTNLLGH